MRLLLLLLVLLPFDAYAGEVLGPGETLTVQCQEPPPAPPPPACISNEIDYLPPDHGMVNVKTDPHCLLKGDGVTDDTAAFQACVTWYGDHRKDGSLSKESTDTLYFPKGTYLLSDTVASVGADGGERAYINLRGTASLGSRIVLAANSQGFSDPNTRKPVWRSGNPGAGVPCCTGSAAQNSIRDLVFEVREGNPGANAIQYMGNNQVSVRNVRVIAAPGSCARGFSVEEKWPGPVVIDKLEIDGCDIGVRVAWEYANLFFERLTVRNQRTVGADVHRGAVLFKGLTSEQTSAIGLRVTNDPNKGGPLVTVLGASLTGTGPLAVSAPHPGGGAQYPHVFLRDVTTSGYTTALKYMNTASFTTMPAEYSSLPIESVAPSTLASLRLPIPDHPHMTHSDPSDWVSIAQFGAVPSQDSTVAIQAAIDSGAKVVYCPAGGYFVSDTIYLRGAVERLVGFDCTIVALGTSMRAPAFKPAMVASASLTHAVEVQDWKLDRGDRTASPFPLPRFIHESPHPVIFTDVLHVAQYRSVAGAGPLFVSDSCCDSWLGLGGNDMTLRGPNVETGAYPNSGDPLGYPDVECVGSACVVLGFKNEGNTGPFLRARDGARFESFGAFHYSSIAGGNSTGPIWECLESECAFNYLGMISAKWAPPGKVIRNGTTYLYPQGVPLGASRATQQGLFVERP